MDSKQQEIEIDVDLADSEFDSYFFFSERNELTVRIQIWNLDMLDIIFYDPILFLDKGCQLITVFCENHSKSPLLLQALKRSYDKIPQKHPYKHFQILDLYDEPVLEIVCQGFKTSLKKFKRPNSTVNESSCTCQDE